ncbi:MAG: HNH endonuclease, partial [Parcubacteria group bacterium]|nr:HNH endonuclease [Parcubacteria group bacterium]
VVDYVFKYFPKARDPWRSVRSLYEKGYLIKVSKGVYRRTPGYKGDSSGDPFSAKTKKAIFKTDQYRCIICGNGRHNGYEIHADHITPRSKGGESIVDNGQTLCGKHNIMKKNYGVTNFLKSFSEKMIKRAKKLKDKKTEMFFKEILVVISKHGF